MEGVLFVVVNHGSLVTLHGYCVAYHDRGNLTRFLNTKPQGSKGTPDHEPCESDFGLYSWGGELIWN